MYLTNLQCSIVIIIAIVLPNARVTPRNSYKAFQRECRHPGCTTQPNFNEVNEKYGIYCATHASPKMINVYSPRCRHPSCRTTPSYSYTFCRKPLYCAKHALPDMQDVKNTSCAHYMCNKTPNFNKPNQKRGLYCADHALPGMEDIKSPKCLHPSCKTQPNYNVPHIKRGIYCAKHALPGMDDVVNPRCKHDTCRTMVQIKKYRGFCLRHFIQEFPDEPIVRNYKTKELAMSRYISERFPNLTWLDDKRIPGGTSGRRGDKMTDLGSHYIIVECDENQHSSYTTELERMTQLSNDVNKRPIIFIRFNTDSYKVNGKRVRNCWGKNQDGLMRITRQKEWDNRLEYLGREIQSAIHTIPTEPIIERYMFYDSTFDERLLCKPCNE